MVKVLYEHLVSNNDKGNEGSKVSVHDYSISKDSRSRVFLDETYCRRFYKILLLVEY